MRSRGLGGVYKRQLLRWGVCGVALCRGVLASRPVVSYSCVLSPGGRVWRCLGGRGVALLSAVVC